MATKCPNCQAIVVPVIVRASGEISTGGGAAIRANFDEETGEWTGKGRQPFRGHYKLEGYGFSIAQCPGCAHVFVAQHNQAVWPLSEVGAAPEIPEPVRAALINAKKAHAVRAEIAALLAARTALIRMQREQGMDSLKSLWESGRITEFLYHQADEVRLWANDVGHEDLPAEVDGADVEQLLEYVDVLFDTLYVQPARLKHIQAKRPLNVSPASAADSVAHEEILLAGSAGPTS